jgi:hypothetical protein
MRPVGAMVALNLELMEEGGGGEGMGLARNWGGHDFGVQLDLAERIQGVTFSRLETFKNLIFEPLKVWSSPTGRPTFKETYF